MKKITAVLILLLMVASLTITVFPVAAQSTPVNPGATGMVSCWALDETSGTRYDSYGSNDLIEHNTVGYASNWIGNAIDLDGTSSPIGYLDVADNASLSLSDAFTIGGWFNTNDFSYYPLVTKAGSDGDASYWMIFDEGSLFFGVTQDGTYTNMYYVGLQNFGLLSTGYWYFFVGMYDGETLSFEINRVRDSAQYSAGVYDSEAPFQLGSYQDLGQTIGFDGQIDETFIYSRALTESELDWLYNDGNGRACSDILGETATETPTVTTAPTSTETTFPTETPTPTPTETAQPGMTATPAPGATPVYPNTISYGELMQITLTTGLCILGAIFLILYILFNTMLRRK